MYLYQWLGKRAFSCRDNYSVLYSVHTAECEVKVLWQRVALLCLAQTCCLSATYLLFKNKKTYTDLDVVDFDAKLLVAEIFLSHCRCQPTQINFQLYLFIFLRNKRRHSMTSFQDQKPVFPYKSIFYSMRIR